MLHYTLFIIHYSLFIIPLSHTWLPYITPNGVRMVRDMPFFDIKWCGKFGANFAPNCRNKTIRQFNIN